MRKLAVSTFLLAVAVTLPLQARGKNESYISFDDGGTVVRQGDDNNREIDARVNLPVFPGDEVITNRRGRTEVRLAERFPPAVSTPFGGATGGREDSSGPLKILPPARFLRPSRGSRSIGCGTTDLPDSGESFEGVCRAMLASRACIA